VFSLGTKQTVGTEENWETIGFEIPTLEEAMDLSQDRLILELEIKN
jgi:hypothetical protein